MNKKMTNYFVAFTILHFFFPKELKLKKMSKNCMMSPESGIVLHLSLIESSIEPESVKQSDAC